MQDEEARSNDEMPWWEGWDVSRWTETMNEWEGGF